MRSTILHTITECDLHTITIHQVRFTRNHQLQFTHSHHVSFTRNHQVRFQNTQSSGQVHTQSPGQFPMQSPPVSHKSMKDNIWPRDRPRPSQSAPPDTDMTTHITRFMIVCKARSHDVNTWGLLRGSRADHNYSPSRSQTNGSLSGNVRTTIKNIPSVKSDKYRLVGHRNMGGYISSIRSPVIVSLYKYTAFRVNPKRWKLSDEAACQFRARGPDRQLEIKRISCGIEDHQSGGQSRSLLRWQG